MIAFIKFQGGQEKRRRKLFKNGRESSWDATLNQAVPRLIRMLAYSPIYTTEKTGPGPIKKWSGPIFFCPFTRLTIRIGLWLKSAMGHMRETTVKQGRLTWRRWYETKMRLHGTFELQKGSGLVFFFRLWGHSRLWPQNQKKASPDPFHEHMVRKVYTAKISCSYQLFYGSGLIFFFSVNGAYDWAQKYRRPASFALLSWSSYTKKLITGTCLACAGELSSRRAFCENGAHCTRPKKFYNLLRMQQFHTISHK